MVTHLRISLGLGCLTSVISPFTLTALIVGSCLCCALIEAFMGWESNYPFVKKVKVHWSPILVMANICPIQA